MHGEYISLDCWSKKAITEIESKPTNLQAASERNTSVDKKEPSTRQDHTRSQQPTSANTKATKAPM